MAHNHLHLKEEHAHEKQFFVSFALIGTLVGGVLLVTSWIAKPIYGTEHAMILALIGSLLLACPIVIHAIKCFLKGHHHMDELVALAIVSLFATSQYDVAGVVSFFMLLSELMETRTALGARAAIESLIKLTPTRANIVTNNGIEKEIKVSELRPGDLVRVRPGDNIPADGQIKSGLSSVNEATITGESLPVDKVPGMSAFAGTSNLTGMLDIEVTKAGKDTTLGKVQSLILEAEQTKIPIMRIIERYVKWYTPTVLMIAIIAGFFTKSFDAFVTVLIISCPCALILATPTAMVAALSAASRLGVLIKNVADLEIVGRITAMVFDKTGTLTTGKLYVTKLTPARNVEPAQLLELATAAEQMSKHPAARALHEVAKEAKIALADCQEFHEFPGKGVSALVAGNKIMVGRESFLKEHHVDMNNVTGPVLHEEQGFSTLYVSRNSICIGWIGLQDKTRPQAKQAVASLFALGIKRVTMLTGDRDDVANRVAGELGCTDFKANCLPHDKLSIVEKIKAGDHTVLVVGDGINDAPALAAGDLGIAMGAAGSDVAINSASIVLMSDDLNRLPFLVTLSKKTGKVINQNLGFGIIFIVLGIGFAFSGYLTAILASILHFVGLLLVVFNSARLVRCGEELDNEPRKIQSV